MPEKRFILCMHQAPKILGFCCCGSVAKFCLTLWDPMDFSILGSAVLHYISEFVQIHVIELVLLSNHLIPCHPLFPLPSIFLSIRVLPMSWLFASGGQSIGASASVLPMNISFRINYFDLLSVHGTLKSLFHSTIWKHQFFQFLFICIFLSNRFWGN